MDLQPPVLYLQMRKKSRLSQKHNIQKACTMQDTHYCLDITIPQQVQMILDSTNRTLRLCRTAGSCRQLRAVRSFSPTKMSGLRRGGRCALDGSTGQQCSFHSDQLNNAIRSAVDYSHHHKPTTVSCKVFIGNLQCHLQEASEEQCLLDESLS